MSHSWKDNAGSPFDTYKQGVVASRGMVSSNHPMASAAGLQMLAMGGNAIDAAIATAFALTVVEPMMIGIFGAGFINFYNGNTGKLVNVELMEAPHQVNLVIASLKGYRRGRLAAAFFDECKSSLQQVATGTVSGRRTE